MPGLEGPESYQPGYATSAHSYIGVARLVTSLRPTSKTPDITHVHHMFVNSRDKLQSKWVTYILNIPHV